MHTAKSLFAECQNKGTRQNTSLPSARKKHSAKTYFAVCQKIALGKDVFCRVFLFAECIFLALGKHGLCRVPDKIHSAKTPALGKSPVSGSVRIVLRLSRYAAVQNSLQFPHCMLPNCVLVHP